MKYPPGSKVTGKITNVTDFGVFVEIEDGVEGLVHVSEISNERIKTPVGQFEVGATVESIIVSINKEEHKVSLSIKRLEEDADKALMREYMGGQTPFSSLGDLLKENLENKAQEMEQSATDKDSEDE